MKYDWFISDTHFSHTNILKFEGEKRPFSSIEEHDEELIRRWNNRVLPGDTVLHLGDVAFKPATSLEDILPRLNGRKTLIPGNHDAGSLGRYLQYFEEVVGCVQDKQNGILFSHFPVHPQELEYRYKVNVHGHTHSKVVVCKGSVNHVKENIFEVPDKRYLNISCEHTNLAPISRDELWNKFIERVVAR